MKKSKSYNRVKFTTEKLKELISKWSEKVPEKEKIKIDKRQINFKDEDWSYDTNEEFFADFSKNYEEAYFELSCYGKDGAYYDIDITSYTWGNTTIKITAPTRAEIEDLFYVIDRDWESYKIPENKVEKKEIPPIIFIGHGRSQQWKELKDHLVDKHHIKVEAYETGARAGHTIRDILEDMLTKSSMAFLILTGEDELKDGKLSARPNVIHETGLFQGRLGFSRAIVLLEEGTDEFSNLFGIQQIRYSKGNIKETFGEVLATIKREFK